MNTYGHCCHSIHGGVHCVNCLVICFKLALLIASVMKNPLSLSSNHEKFTFHGMDTNAMVFP